MKTVLIELIKKENGIEIVAKENIAFGLGASVLLSPKDLCSYSKVGVVFIKLGEIMLEQHKKREENSGK